MTDVVVLGAGLIGMAVAWRCAQRGLEVTVVDPDPGRGAWHTAAGMLAPTTELHVTETTLFRLNLESLARYPDFVAELSDATGREIGYLRCGALAVAWDGADLAALRDLQVVAHRLDIDARLLTGRELREFEPALASALPGGLLADSDHEVDPRALHAALTAANDACGVHQVRAAGRPDIRDDHAVGVLLQDGSRLAAASVVLATGAWSGQSGVSVPVRPVKGQTLRLTSDLELERIVRAVVRGSPVYVVPRGDGRLVVGASVEEAGFDVHPRAGAVYELLRDAQSILPELSEAVLDEVAVGLRPTTPDNVPLVGASGIDGLLLATGHYRNGVLLTPLTADAITELIVDGKRPDVLAAADPQRFDQEFHQEMTR